MWIRIRMDPQVFETPNLDPESAYFAYSDPGSKVFFLVISKNMYVHVEIWYKFPSTSSLFPISLNTSSKKSGVFVEI